MNIEDYREYCLSLGDDIEEKLPFQKFKSGEGVLVFYVSGHMFSFFDCDNLVRVPGQFFQQSIGSRGGIDAYPVLGRLVVRISDTIILHLQVLDALRLTLQRDD